MSFETENLIKQKELNVVIEIDGTPYAMKQPDSGLVVDSDKLVIDSPRINSVTVDVRKPQTPIGTFSFIVRENSDDPIISSTIMQDATQWLKKEAIIKIGHITGSFDYTDYKEVGRTRITSVTKIRNGYSIKTNEITVLVDNEAININDVLQTALIPASTSLDVVDGSQFPASGKITINGECIGYSSKTGNTLENLTRGILGSTAEEHDLGEQVFLVTEALAVNPIDFILQILLSKDGDLTNHGTYDVYANGLGISPNDVDIATFESIRDEFFLGEQHDYYIYDNSSMLKFLEETALLATNTRLITIGGKVSLSLIDQVDFDTDVLVLDESSVIGTPSWSIDENKIVNRIEISYDFNIATQEYESLAVVEDSDSITNFGLKKPLKLKFPGVKTSLSGGSIVSDRAARLLARLSTARGNITVNTHFDGMNVELGGNIQLVHRFLPQQGGTLGFSDRLEVMSRSVNLQNATVKLRLEFTSYTGIRLAFIAPSPRITSVIDTKNVVVDDASCLKKGYIIKGFKDGPLVLGEPTAGSYLPDDANEIESIVGNQVTFKNAWVSTLGTDIVLKMADYDEANEEQKARYAFICQNSAFFASDGSKAYQIIF